MYALSRMLVAGAAVALLSSPVRVAAQDDCEAERCATQGTIAGECSCEGAANHGDYVSCVANAASGLVSEECTGAVVRCAARSTCGKEGAVVCLRPKFGPCDRTSGTCRKDPSTSCTTSHDCVSGARCSIKRSERACTDHGGMVVAGASNCCAPCGVVPTTSTTTPVTTTTSTTAPGSPSGAFATP
jgi:hypothetical protein